MVPERSTATRGSTFTVCTHCGLDVPPGLIDESADLQFCCSGCRAVYEVIHSQGLEKFYRLQDRDQGGVPARTTGRGYEEYDDPVFLKRHTSELGGGARSAELYLEGIHCAACVWLVERLPRLVPGLIEARLDMRKALVRVLWDENAVALSCIASALDSLGYVPHPARDTRLREARLREDRRFLIRIGVAAATAGNVMLLAFALYGGMLGGMQAEYNALFRWSSMLIGMVALLWPGNVFLRGAWAALRTRTAHLDLPIAFGLAVGAVAGIVNTVTGRGEVYFDSLTLLIFLLLVGRWIQHRQQRWASDSLELLFSLTPSFARRVEGAGTRDVPVEVIEPGDIVEVLAGETLPADGRVVEGESTVDPSLLTGESRPAAVEPGAEVFAGTINLHARLRVRIEVAGTATRVGRLMQLVEEYARRKAPIVQLTDRIAAWFVAVVIALAAGTFGAWLGLDASRAVDNTAALLIVTCPCALGLATPLAVAVALGRAAKQGILIKGGDALERLASRGLMLLDKTGTITAGRAALVQWRGDEDAQKLVAALETHSSHPIARAFVNPSLEESTLKTEGVSQTAGAGIEGTVSGRFVSVGSPGFVRKRVREDPAWAHDAHGEIAGKGLTPIWISVDRMVVAVAGIGDPVRPDAAKAVEALRRLGWRLEVLSGDDPRVVASVAGQLGVERSKATGGLTPEEKVARVESASSDGHVVMVGDGVNDAAALSAATVGIAVHGGAEASLAAADVYLSRPGLRPVVDLMVAARRTMRVIGRCLIVSLLYNAVAATLAAVGAINPLIAAILMPASSFTVLAIALGARTFGDDGCR